MKFIEQRPAVEHIQQPEIETAWSSGMEGWLSRIRGLASFLVIEAGAVGIIWTYVSDRNGTVASLVLTLSVMIAMSATVLAWREHRKHRIYHADVWKQFHLAMHDLRDHSHKMISLAHRLEDPIARREKLEEFSQTFADRVCEVFRKITSHQQVHCAIRLAQRSDNGSVEYATIVRSYEMERGRAVTTEPVHNNDGIPKLLSSNENVGVLIYHDLEAAAQAGAFKMTHNDQVFTGAKRFMVAPINGYNPGRRSDDKEMFGLLYVTSPDDIFNATHVDALRGFSDIAGHSFPRLVWVLSGDGSGDTIRPPSN